MIPNYFFGITHSIDGKQISLSGWVIKPPINHDSTVGASPEARPVGGHENSSSVFYVSFNGENTGITML